MPQWLSLWRQPNATKPLHRYFTVSVLSFAASVLVQSLDQLVSAVLPILGVNIIHLHCLSILLTSINALQVKFKRTYIRDHG